MSEVGTSRSTSLLAWSLLVIGMGVIAIAQITHLQAGAVATAGGAVAPAPLVACLADDIVEPLLRAFGNPAPGPAEIAAGMRYVIFGVMALGLVLCILAARQLMKARRR